MSFISDLNFGDAGEKYFAEKLTSVDIDAVISSETNFDILVPETWLKYEVKADRWAAKTGNLCLELFSHVDNRNPGWMQYSIADILVFLFYNQSGTEVEDMYFFDFPALRSHVFWNILHGDWFCDKPTIGRVVAASSNPNVRNLLLPLDATRGVLLKRKEDL